MTTAIKSALITLAILCALSAAIGAAEASRHIPDTDTMTITAVQQETFYSINQTRLDDRKPRLIWHPALALAAQLHAEDMAANDYASHTGLNGSTPGDRVAVHTDDCVSVSENAAVTDTYNRDPMLTGRRLATGWYDSPGHRSNLLADWTYTGIGYVYADTTQMTITRGDITHVEPKRPPIERLWVVQIFCR